MVKAEHAAPGVVQGGRAVYGVPLGILSLDTSFPRVPGDVGNASTWPFPVIYRVVTGADPDSVVRRLGERTLLEPFVRAAQDLERAGVSLITTTCGFLVLFQSELQDAVSVPVLTSSLLQVPWVLSTLPPGRGVGILTVERSSLTPAHLRAAGIEPDAQVEVVGLDEAGGYFSGQMLNNRPELDVDRCGLEHERAAQLLMERMPDIGAVVLECTNMPPYASRVQRITGLPVHDLTTLITWNVAAVRRAPFNGFM
jgi:hypothetical protein